MKESEAVTPKQYIARDEATFMPPVMDMDAVVNPEQQVKATSEDLDIPPISELLASREDGGITFVTESVTEDGESVEDFAPPAFEEPAPEFGIEDVQVVEETSSAEPKSSGSSEDEEDKKPSMKLERRPKKLESSEDAEVEGESKEVPARAGRKPTAKKSGKPSPKKAKSQKSEDIEEPISDGNPSVSIMGIILPVVETLVAGAVFAFIGTQLGEIALANVVKAIVGG